MQKNVYLLHTLMLVSAYTLSGMDDNDNYSFPANTYGMALPHNRPSEYVGLEDAKLDMNDEAVAHAVKFESDPVKRLIEGLYKGKDPHRYGKINIDNSDKKPAYAQQFQNIIEGKSCSDSIHICFYGQYHLTRYEVARAVTSGYYNVEFANVATDYNDLPLWQYLIAHQDQIKKQHEIDIASHPIGSFRTTPPLCAVKSLEIVKLLVETGKASIANQKDNSFERRGESPLHAACRDSRPSNILEYCVTQYPDGIHSRDNKENLPSHALCREFCYSEAPCDEEHKQKYLSEGIAKFTILQKAGDNFILMNKDKKSPLDILKDRIAKSNECNDAKKVLSRFVSHLTAILEGTNI